MRALVPYYGGKQRIAKKIVELIPPHLIYCEPCCGGAAVFFAKGPLLNPKNYKEALNDIDKRLINFYRVIQEKPGELLWRLKNTLYSEAEYKRAKVILQHLQNFSAVDRAWAYYVGVGQAFSNIVLGGWRRCFVGSSALTWRNRVRGLKMFLGRMSNVYLSCVDALTFIKQWDSPQTCFYCDPPYPGSIQGYTYKYSYDEFQKLVDVLASIQGSFLLSCYKLSTKEIKIPSEWELFGIKTTMTATMKGRVSTNKSKKATQEELGDASRVELIYRKLRTAKVRPDIQIIMDKMRKRIPRKIKVFREVLE